MPISAGAARDWEQRDGEDALGGRAGPRGVPRRAAHRNRQVLAHTWEEELSFWKSVGDTIKCSRVARTPMRSGEFFLERAPTTFRI